MPHRKRKITLPLGSIMLIDEDPLDLTRSARMLGELKLVKDLLVYDSVKDAFENLMLLKKALRESSPPYPELILADLAAPYFNNRSFLNDLLLLYPEKIYRPTIIQLWKTQHPPSHRVLTGLLHKPLEEEKLREMLLR